MPGSSSRSIKVNGTWSRVDAASTALLWDGLELCNVGKSEA